MSRAQRIVYENAYYHVMNRGGCRRAIFTEDVDREIFLETLREASEQYCLEVHAYCLMDNHYHLLIKTPRANLSVAMRHINGVYTQRYNRMNGTDGALFRGRYKAILVDSDAYLLHLSKYIHLNPLSAQMVDSLNEYEWSSYLAYVDKINAPRWLVRDEVYGQLTETEHKAAHYQNFMSNEPLNRALEKFYSHQSVSPILGDDAFINSLSLVKPPKEIPRHSQVYRRPSIAAVISEVAILFGEEEKTLTMAKKGRVKSNVPRKMAMYIARKYGDYRFQELADAFGLQHYGGASYAVHTFARELRNDPGLGLSVDKIVEKLMRK